MGSIPSPSTTLSCKLVIENNLLSSSDCGFLTLVFVYLGWIPLEINGPYTAIPFRPHWPYIISHCCLVGDINPEVARMRLKLILDTMNTYNDRRGILDEFVVPSFTGKFEMKYEKLKKWMSIMYPVVGNLRSRFHSPCDVVSRSFDHLL